MEIAQIVLAISMEKLRTIRKEFRLQLVIQKPFCKLLNVKLFKRQTPAPPEVLYKKGVL